MGDEVATLLPFLEDKLKQGRININQYENILQTCLEAGLPADDVLGEYQLQEDFSRYNQNIDTQGLRAKQETELQLSAVKDQIKAKIGEKNGIEASYKILVEKYKEPVAEWQNWKNRHSAYPDNLSIKNSMDECFTKLTPYFTELDVITAKLENIKGELEELQTMMQILQ